MVPAPVGLTPWTATQRRIVSEQAFHANRFAVVFPEDWDAWIAFLNLCRVIDRARGLAPRRLEG